MKTSTQVRPTESNFQWKKKINIQKHRTNLQVHRGNNLTESKKKSEQSKADLKAWKIYSYTYFLTVVVGYPYLLRVAQLVHTFLEQQKYGYNLSTSSFFQGL